MRRHLRLALVLGVILASAGLALYGRAAERAARETPVALVPPEEAGREGAEPPGASGDETRTLPVTETATEADGLLEVRVTEGGRPVPRAQMRLYRRGGRLLETGRVNWRVAAAGATGDDGRLLMPARSGAYLLVARAEGFAPAWRDLVHPLDGNRTPVHLRLEEAGALTGRTVAQGSGDPLPEVELTLTPHVSAWEQEVRADAPAEERVKVRSDAAGNFHVEGLAPGLYTVEGSVPGVPDTVEWNLRVPTAEPQVLALPGSGEEEPLRTPQRAPSKELRCGY
jgi:hypothetical protein